MQKGLSTILIILGIALLLGVAGGAYYFGRSQVKSSVSQPETIVSPTATINISPSPVVSPIKRDSYTEDTAVPNQKRYVSPKLGISFLYLTQVDGQKMAVKEVEQKINVYPANMAYQDGQWVEVFNKDKADTLAEAIKKQFLNGILEKECFVVINKDSFKSYPKSYSVTEISYPQNNDPNIGPGEIPAVCPQGYSQTNGIRYFLGDSNHPEKLLFFSIGQYGINSGESNKSWQDTIQFLD